MASKDCRSFTNIEAEKSWKSFLERLADSLAEEGDTKAAQELRNLQHGEAQRDQARRIRPISDKALQLAMTRLTIQVQNPDSSVEVMELFHKDEMELAAPGV